MVYPHTYRTEHCETRTTNCDYGAYYVLSQSKKIPIQPDLLKILQHIDSNRDKFLKDLSDFVAIRSVSGLSDYKNETQKMYDLVEKWLVKLGLKYEPFNIGYQEIGGKKVRLPSIILATLGRNSSKRTIVVYANIDVKNPDSAKWATDSWEIKLVQNKIFGCGVAQGKSTLLHWFHLIEAFKQSAIDFPVNLKFVIEGMYHHDSLGLIDFLSLRKHDFFADVHSIIICDSEWIGEKHPCIIYGTVGILHYDIKAEKSEDLNVDLKNDLKKITEEIVGEEEKVLVPHFDDIVAQITPEEEKVYENITDFNVEDARSSLPLFKQKWDQVKLLMTYWRLPSIWIGETEECTCLKKKSNIMKKHMIVKIVPRQIIGQIINLIINYVQYLTKKHDIKSKITCELISSTRYWSESVTHDIYQAARRATIQIYKEDPNMIREDRSRVLLTIFDQVLETNILLLPLVPKGSNPGGANENIPIRNFYESTKLLAAYLFQISK